MPTVHRTFDAELDLQEIWLRVARRDLAAADRLFREIEDRCDLYATAPEMGQPRDDYEPGLRSFTVRRFIVFYRPTDEGIRVLRVIPGARDLPAAFFQ